MISKSLFVGIIIGFSALILFLLSPNGSNYPAFILGFCIFLFVQILFPSVRLSLLNLFDPLNITQYFFYLQIIIIPVIILYSGVAQNTLPWLPSNPSINIAYILNVLAYFSFCLFYHIFSKNLNFKISKEIKINNLGNSKVLYPIKNMNLLILVYFVIGVLGFIWFFGGISGYIQYVSNPTTRIIYNSQISATLKEAAKTFFRPFLGASIVLLWSIWIDKASNRKKQYIAPFVTGFIFLILIIVNTHYNRMYMVGPLLALLGTYSEHVRRISLKFFVLITVVFILFSFFIGLYRRSNTDIGSFSTNVQSTFEDTLKPLEEVQVYGNGPQFFAFLIEQIDYGSKLHYGGTIIPSILYPVPILGKPFREASAVILYNRLIYGNYPIIDQIVPFQGELFLNFHFPGIIVGYSLLAFLFSKLRSKFMIARNAFEKYSLFFMCIWLCFLIIGSITVTSQIYVYFFWPIYIYFLLNSFSKKVRV